MINFIAVDYSRCSGCKACEVTCSLYHFGECNPAKSLIHVIRQERGGLVFCLPLVCQSCEPAPCIEACPTSALYRDEERGLLTIDENQCSFCGLCAEACPIGCLSIDTNTRAVLSCDLCGGQPQCVIVCHAHCLTEADKSRAQDTQNMEYLREVLQQHDLQDSLPAGRIW